MSQSIEAKKPIALVDIAEAAEKANALREIAIPEVKKVVDGVLTAYGKQLEVFQNIPLIHPKDMPKIAYKDKVLCIPNMEMPLAQDDQTDAHSVVKPPVADDMVTFHHMEYHVKFLEQLIEEFQAPGKANVMVIDTCGAGNVLRASSRRGLYTIVLCENEATVAYLKEVARVELATRLDEFGGAGLKANLDLMGLKLSDVTLKRKKKTLQTKLMFKRQKTGTATENATSSSSSSDSTVE